MLFTIEERLNIENTNLENDKDNFTWPFLASWLGLHGTRSDAKFISVIFRFKPVGTS